jgi:hypothetical protein
MRTNLLKSAVVLLAFSFYFSNVSAQESINTTGGNASGSGGSASYSVGQVTYKTHTGTNSSVAEGVQQPFEISVVTAIEDAEGINLSVSAYPNPANDYLILEVVNFLISPFTFHLFDINGKLLQSGEIISTQTSISMNTLAPATYFVKVMQEGKEVKTFKIIKN